MESICQGSGRTRISILPMTCWCLMATERPMLMVLFSEPTKTMRQSGGMTLIMWRIWGTRCGIGRCSTMSAILDAL